MSEAQLQSESEAEMMVEAPSKASEVNVEPVSTAKKSIQPGPESDPRRDSKAAPKRDSKAGALPPPEGPKDSNAGRKSVKSAGLTTQPPVESEPQPGPLVLSKPPEAAKRMSMFDEGTTIPGSGVRSSLRGKPGKVADIGAKDLAGTLQKFFTQEEKTTDSALKPLRRPKLIHQNTYRMQAYNPFSRDRVQKLLELTLEELVEPLKYNSEATSDIAMKISEKIRARVLSLRFDRYKIVVLTNIGPLNRQGIHIGFRCLLDPETDSYATATYKNATVFASAVVYGIYYE